MEVIGWDDFARVGRVLEAAPFPEAHHPAYKLRIDFGPETGVRTSFHDEAGDVVLCVPDGDVPVGAKLL